jgi:cell wall-associated NlpC family hydrolase
VLRTADAYVGRPYAWGGSTPRGFDCSGFVQYVFARHAVELPRTSRQQAQVGAKVARGRAALRPGDLIFFATGARGRAIDHVAIYAGAGRFIHASSSGHGVRYDDFATRRGQWFAKYQVATRRVLSAADGRSIVRALDAALRAWAPLDPPDAAPVL